MDYRPRGQRFGETSLDPSDYSKADEAGAAVGRRLRALRETRGLTLTQVAASCNRSVGYLSQIERGISQPTVQVLHDLSRLLGVQVGWFFEERIEPLLAEMAVVVREGERRSISFATGITDMLLSPNLKGELELLLSTFSPGASSGDQPYTHDGEEAGLVLEGELTLAIGDDVFRLVTGDSFSFKSMRPHRYWNAGATEAKVVWVVTPPTY